MPADSTRTPQLLFGLSILSVALVFSAYLGSNALTRIKNASNEITVTGSARKAIRSDYVVWEASITCQRENLQDAYQDLKKYTARLKGYFKEKQIPEEGLTFIAVQTSAVPEVLENGRETGRTKAYRLTQGFEIRSADVDKITTVARDSNELINEGIIINASAPQYIYTKLSELRIEMLAAAAKDAQQRAQMITQSTSTSLGPVRSVQTGVFQITKRNSTEVDDMGMYDTTSIEKDITAVLTMSFGVD